jgi:hypothetical protein
VEIGEKLERVLVSGYAFEWCAAVRFGRDAGVDASRQFNFERGDRRWEEAPGDKMVPPPSPLRSMVLQSHRAILVCSDHDLLPRKWCSSGRSGTNGVGRIMSCQNCRHLYQNLTLKRTMVRLAH